MSDLGDALRLFLIWDSHRQVLHPYKVCTRSCPEGWPCISVTTTERDLRQLGVDPYAVRRREVTLEPAEPAEPAESTDPADLTEPGT
ncbi:hypothetical protein AB0I28_38120 [Phytomonospora sp. NPDC050363]|uniref:hypothetical protein n=1 Tax=Phytomonospora sp. NPDC050363 TaxID=3155642 RepID=UPI00340DB01C